MTKIKEPKVLICPYCKEMSLVLTPNKGERACYKCGWIKFSEKDKVKMGLKE